MYPSPAADTCLEGDERVYARRQPYALASTAPAPMRSSTAEGTSTTARSPCRSAGTPSTTPPPGIPRWPIAFSSATRCHSQRLHPCGHRARPGQQLRQRYFLGGLLLQPPRGHLDAQRPIGRRRCPLREHACLHGHKRHLVRHARAHVSLEGDHDDVVVSDTGRHLAASTGQSVRYPTSSAEAAASGCGAAWITPPPTKLPGST